MADTDYYEDGTDTRGYSLPKPVHRQITETHLGGKSRVFNIPVSKEMKALFRLKKTNKLLGG